MGENNAVLSRGAPVTRDSLLAAASIYQSMYANPDGSVPATFQVRPSSLLLDFSSHGLTCAASSDFDHLLKLGDLHDRLVSSRVPSASGASWLSTEIYERDRHCCDHPRRCINHTHTHTQIQTCIPTADAITELRNGFETDQFLTVSMPCRIQTLQWDGVSVICCVWHFVRCWTHKSAAFFLSLQVSQSLGRMAAPTRLEALWTVAPTPSFTSNAAPRSRGATTTTTTSTNSCNNSSECGSRMAPTLPPAFPIAARKTPHAVDSTRHQKYPDQNQQFEQLHRHEPTMATNPPNAARIAAQQQSRSQAWSAPGMVNAYKGTYQPQQPQYQLPQSQSPDPANAAGSSSSSTYRSSAVIQPGVAIVPPHYQQIPVELQVPRMGPPLYHLPFVHGYSSYNGHQSASPRGEYYYGQISGGTRQSTLMYDSVAQGRTSQRSVVPNSTPVTFIPYGAALADGSAASQDPRFLSISKSNNYVADNQFGKSIWSRAQHYSPAASAIDARFSGNAQQQSLSNIFNQRHGDAAEQESCEPEGQSAVFAAAETLFNLQSPVFSPRSTEAHTTMGEPTASGHTRQVQPKPEPKPTETNANLNKNGIAHLLNMSTEQQSYALSIAADTRVEAGFSDDLRGGVHASFGFGQHDSSQNAYLVAQQLKQQHEVYFNSSRGLPDVDVSALGVPPPAAAAAVVAQVSQKRADGEMKKEVPVKRRRKQDRARESKSQTLVTLSTKAASDEHKSTAAASQVRSFWIVPDAKLNSTRVDGAVKKKAPAKRQRKQDGAQESKPQKPVSTSYKLARSGHNPTPPLQTLSTLPDAHLDNKRKKRNGKTVRMMKLDEEAKHIYAASNASNPPSTVPRHKVRKRFHIVTKQDAERIEKEESSTDCTRPVPPPAVRSDSHPTASSCAAGSADRRELPSARGEEHQAQQPKELATTSVMETHIGEIPRHEKVAPPPVANVIQENSTVMIFCKRDFMRYQAVKLWKKYQEKKKKLEYKSTQVSGKRTRYHNPRYPGRPSLAV